MLGGRREVGAQRLLFVQGRDDDREAHSQLDFGSAC
jgi:hypothetical protein